MTVSIIIKALNEERRIGAAIESALAALEALPDGQGEVILSDSGSTDRTIEIARHYPIVIVQLERPAKPSCGLGPQLGFQYSKMPYICLMDADTELAPDFITEAMKYLEANLRVAGVTGHVMERNNESLEYLRRGLRQTPYKAVGVIDRINCGGLYRRAAIDEIGYLSDRNLHSYEEYDLGVRLRTKGWSLFRLDRRFVYHTGHSVNAYKLLLKRWQSKYIRGIGELLRSAIGKPYFKTLFAELPELRLWMGVYAWIIVMLLILAVLPHKVMALLIDLVMIAAVVALMSVKHRSLSIGLYSVTAWFFHAAALPLGFFKSRKNPAAAIESKRIQNNTF